ncbi:hypothetical protein BJ912DRAFT_444917 [Pholiota molesta]|nr:hypothetical protein BJ912DRAFT_444917 [Pholiota molesta]
MPRILSIDDPVSFLCPISVFVSLPYLHFSVIFFIYLSLCIIFASIRSVPPPAAGFIIDGDLLSSVHFFSAFVEDRQSVLLSCDYLLVSLICPLICDCFIFSLPSFLFIILSVCSFLLPRADSIQ